MRTCSRRSDYDHMIEREHCRLKEGHPGRSPASVVCAVSVWWPIQWLELCLFKMIHWLAAIPHGLAHIVWRKVRRLASIQSPIWNTYSTETREAKLRQCLSPTVLLFDMWRESHIFNKIVTTHNHSSEESVVVIYNLTWFSMSIMVSQCLSWSI